MTMFHRVASITLTSAVLLGGGAAFAATQSPAGPTTATATAASDPTVGSCLPPGHDDAWPDDVQGRPGRFDAGDLGGVYAWHDHDGWHLRVTHHNDDRAVFTGTIVTRGRLVNVTGVALEPGDTVKIGPNGHELRFSFQNYGHIDGVDFHTERAPALGVSVQRGDNELPADRVFLGDHESHPARDPFRIARTG